MKVYELITALALMPAGADVCAAPSEGGGMAMNVSSADYMGADVARLVLDGSYEGNIESGDDDA